MHAVRHKAVKQLTLAALATVALSAPAYAAGGMLEGLAGVKANGYIEGQYNYNLNDPYDQSNNGRVFDGVANSFTGNMAELALTKSTADGLGFGLVLNYGEDSRLLDSGTPGSPIFVQQAYVMDRVFGNTVDLKFGKLATLAGAEVIEGPANYNISRSFLFGLAIPFTHTGLRAGIGTGMKNVSLTLGLNNGWDNDVDGDKGKTLEAQVGLSPMDMVSLVLNGYYGTEPTGADSDNRGLFDLVATLKPTDGVAIVFNYDRGSQARAGGAGTGSALWQGYAIYANMALGDKHSVSLRGEVFDDQDGFRTGVVGGVTARELTLTLSCKMKENLEWRAEVRHDEANSDQFADKDVGTFTDTQNTVAVAAYYTF